MSDHVAKSDSGSDGTARARQSMDHYQAAWMGHWKHKSHKPSTEVHNHLLQCHGQKKDDHRDSKKHPLLSGPEMATNISKYAQGFREVSEARTVDTMKKSLKTGSMKLGKDILDGQPFPLFMDSGNGESAMSSKGNKGTSFNVEAVKYQIDLNDGNNTFTMGRSEWAYPEIEYPPRECKFPPEGISEVPEQLMKSQELLEENSLAVSSKDDVGSSSKILPYVVNGGVAPTQSFTCQHENIAKSSPVGESEDHFMDAKKVCNYSTLWVHEKKADALFKSGKPGSSVSRQNDVPLFVQNQSTNNSKLCSSLDEQSQTVENNANIRLLPRLNYTEEMKSGKAYDEHSLLPKIAHSVHDVKTMRICTAIDSVEEIPKGTSKFSQITHQFFMKKNTTGVNLTEGGQGFRDAIVSPKLRENMFNEFLSLSPSFSFHDQQGVKLQPIESSTDSEGKDNVGDVRTSILCLKNESSVETDAMELDVFQKSCLSSVAFCPADQNIKGVHNSSLSQTENATREEAGNKMVNTELPDMNEGRHACPVVANSIDDGGTSTSRTQSLDAEHLLCHAEQPSNSNTAACPDGPLEPEPCSRWVKRLKLSTSDHFALGSKSSKIGKVSSHEKVTKIFRKTSSRPTAGRSHVGPELALEQTAMLLKNCDSTSSDSVRKSQEISLSCSWIHRWCRHRAASPNKKPDAVVLCEPQSSKATLNELQKKQFPSLAAMALMGKAMSTFRPCEFRRRGSLIVWKA